MEQVLYTREQTAHLLALGLTKVDELIGSGRIPAVKIGRAVRIPRESVEGFVKELRAAAEVLPTCR